MSPFRLAVIFAATTWFVSTIFAQQGEDREASEGARSIARPLAHPLLRVFDAEELGVSSANHHVTVAANGLVYVANGYGILEYDGETWRRIPQSFVSQATILSADAQGRLWARLHEMLYQLSPDKTGALRLIERGGLFPPGQDVGVMLDAMPSPNGIYFFSASHLVLVRPDDTVTTWPATGQIESVFTLTGVVYVTQRDQGIFRVEAGALVPVSTGVTKNVPAVYAARPVAGGAPGIMLVTRNGPYRWDGPGSDVKPLSPASAALFRESSAPFRAYTANRALFLADGRMVFGGHGGLGFLVLFPDGSVQYQLKKSDGLPSPWINDLAEDAQGGIWLAHPTGITRVQLDSPYATYTGGRGLNGAVRDVARRDGHLYLAHAEGVWVGDDALTSFRLLGDLPANTSGANRFLPLGPRLLVTASGGREVLPTNRLQPIGITQQTYQLTPSLLQPGWFVAVERSTLHRRLWLYAPAGSKLRPVGPVPTVKDPDRFALDSGDGFIWGTTIDGQVWRADFRSGLRVDAPADYFDLGLPPTDYVETASAIVFSFAGGIEVGGGGKLLRYDSTSNRFVPETRIAGLPAAAGFRPPVASTDGALWFLYQGSAHDPETRIFRVASDGPDRWRAVEFPTAAIRHVLVNNLYEEPDLHRLWVATNLGLLSADTAWQPLRPRPPLSVLVRRVETGDGHALFAGAAGRSPSQLILQPDATALRFSFAAPSHATDFQGRTRLLYRTRLDGFDESWTEWSAKTAREFTNLPPRDFGFQVQVRDPDGRESRPVTFAFTLPPPWWRTPWAIVGYGLAGAIVLLGLERLRTRSLRRENEKLEAVVATRTTDLRLQNTELARLHRLELDEKISARLGEEKARLDVLRYQLNPHFLFNSLTAIRSQISSANTAARDAVERLTDFCRLTLHGRKPDENSSIGEEMAMLRAYLDIEQARMRDLLRVEFDLAPGLEARPLPRMLLLPLVENALKYGQATSPPPLQLRITVRSDAAGSLFCEIANTGRWVRHAATHDLPSLGIGHDNLRERLQRHYPDCHTFNHEEAGGWVLVRVTISAS